MNDGTSSFPQAAKLRCYWVLLTLPRLARSSLRTGDLSIITKFQERIYTDRNES